ncbi:MAG: NAD-dependent deacylase [Bacteroidales bacterium]|nr:NAD-dependent deacylase [Bacteroidales bacterium]MCK9449858.1 NAD-dependent deacylase [Bacteroidales bacterium]MDD3700758.1 NAD-dependent deacylase [Bacteroidales bacterium]MDY0369350.1 NAD-dependent deacylase [Bacteroidales bacterium]
MRKLVVLTGAGMSAESGIKTFRDSDGLWRTHRFEDLATPEAWERNPALVQEFYNERRKQLFEVEPNAGHKALVELEKVFDVQIITQNVDDLHERAGSANVLHLHGELKKARSTVDPSLIYELKHWELKMGEHCEKGSQLRPHIVWFGESVPAMSEATQLTRQAELFLIVGTSLQVYPAASLLHYVPSHSPVYLVDPKAEAPAWAQSVKTIRKTAATGLPELVNELIRNETVK